MTEQLQRPTPAELDALTALWEASVRATHRFLAEGEVEFFRPMVRGEALPAAELYVTRDSGGAFTAFMGLDGDKIEMLFVAPKECGHGLGRELAEYAIRHRGIRHVDVNEQNEQAVGFYARMGFRVAGRDAEDPSGRPYPILHLEL